MRRLATISAVVLTIALLLGGVGCAPKEVTIGNKNFTEQHIIAQMMKQLLEDRGFKVNFVSNLSTTALRQGMKAGDIDICAEYTGTAWIVHLDHAYEPGADNNELYQLVKEEEERLRTFLDFEFSARPDGLPALEEFYDFRVDRASLMTGVPGASLTGLEDRKCEVAMVFGTDPIIAKYGWHVYLDDQAFFPPYDLTPYVRAEVLDKYPEIADILNELVATFPGRGELATPEIVAEGQTVWQALNAKVDIDKMEPDEVAHDYLAKKGLIKK